MKRIWMAVVALVVVAGWAGKGGAQGGPGLAPPRDPSEYLARLFDKELAFTAVAQMTVANAAGKPLHVMEMEQAARDGNLRTQMDMARMKGADMPAEAVAQMKAMGMDVTVTLFQTEKRLGYMIYPGLKAYAPLPMAGHGTAAPEKPPKIDRADLGPDTVDGHPCVKQRVTITTADGDKQELLVWAAKDLKDFPLKTEISANGQTITIQYKNIKLTAPPAEWFAEPKGFTRYGSVEALMMGSMKRMMPEGHPPILAPE